MLTAVALTSYWLVEVWIYFSVRCIIKQNPPSYKKLTLIVPYSYSYYIKKYRFLA